MGSITNYEIIKSRAFYWIEFELNGKKFSLTKGAGIESSEETLRLVHSFLEKGFSPQVSRKIVYDNDKSGFLTKASEYEHLTLERLEEIVKNNEPLPEFKKPIVESSYRCTDI